VRAKAIINACGPWSDSVNSLARSPVKRSTIRGSKGAHIAVPRSRLGNTGDSALTILSPIDGRVMFILPAGEQTIIGTTETEFPGSPDDVRATGEDIAYLLRSANYFFPEAHLAMSDVTSAWAGIRPLAASQEANAGKVSREHAIAEVAPGVLAITGGKLTTYRVMASDAVDSSLQVLAAGPSAFANKLGEGQTDRVPLPGGDIESLEAEQAVAASATGDPALGAHLARRYGSEWRTVWSLAQESPALRERLTPGADYLMAELHFGVKYEMALKLGDLLIRRLHLAFETPDHGLSAAPRAAHSVAPLLGWDQVRIAAEVEAYALEVRSIFG
jgi:glycerol-3-phosphate dehydrogenase